MYYFWQIFIQTPLNVSYRKNILSTYTAQIASSIISLLSTILTTRMLGTSGQGTLSIYINFIMFASILLGLGMPLSIVHFVASKKIDKQKLFPILFSVITIAFIVAGLVLVVFIKLPFFESALPNFVFQQKIWFAVIPIHILLVISNAFLLSVCQAENEFNYANLIILSGTLFFFLVYLIKYFTPIFNSYQPLQFVCIVLFLGNCLQFIFYNLLLLRRHPIYFSMTGIKINYIIPMLSFSCVALLTNFFQLLSFKIDLWFINFYHNASQTGIYSLASSLAQILWLFPIAVQTVLYTTINQHQDDKEKILITIKAIKKIALYSSIALVMGIFSIIFFIPLLFGQAFILSIPCVQILLFGLAIFSISMPICAYFYATGKAKINLISTAIGLSVCLLGNALFTPTYSFYGASYTAIVAYSLSAIFLFIQFGIVKNKLAITARV
jgi:O-antigen/teichoic acid export membrane protein